MDGTKLPETLFSIVNSIALLGWIGLVVASLMRAGNAQKVLLNVSGRWVPLLLCTAYLGFLVYYWGTAPGGGFDSLGAVQMLFSVPGVLLAGWTHYLAFDLFVGRWIVDDALSPSRSRIPLVWALPFTFLFGPVGVLLYLVGRLLVPGRREQKPGDVVDSDVVNSLER